MIWKGEGRNWKPMTTRVGCLRHKLQTCANIGIIKFLMYWIEVTDFDLG